MYTPTYLGEIDLSEETLAHYGVKGMKWGRRKLKEATNNIKKKLKNTKLAKARRHNKYVASHLAKDIVDNKRQLWRPYGNKNFKPDEVTKKYDRGHDDLEIYYSTRANRPRIYGDVSLYKTYKGEKVARANTSKDGIYDPDGYRTTTYRDLKKAISSEERRKKKK